MSIVTGAVRAEADTHDPGQTRQLVVADPANSGTTQASPLPGAGTQPVKPVTERFAFEMPPPTYPGPGRQLPGTGTQPVLDWLGMICQTCQTRCLVTINCCRGQKCMTQLGHNRPT